MKASGSFFGALVVAIACTTSVAMAAPPAGGDADALRAQGMEAFRAQDYEAARVAFTRSYELLPRISTLLSLAVAELQSGHPLEAARHFRQYMRAPDAPADKVEEVRRKMLPKAESQLGRVQVDAPPGSRVFIDGSSAGTAPLDPVDVNPGDHAVVIEHGSRTYRLTVPVAAGALARARADVDSDPVPTAPAPTAAAAPSPAPSAPDHADASSTWPTTKKIVVFSAAAAGALAFGASAYFAVQSNSAADDARSLHSQLVSQSACVNPTPDQGAICNRLTDAYSTQSQDHNLSIGFAVAGGVLAVGAIAAWLFWPAQTDGKARAHIAPSIGGARGGPNGLLIVGTF
jgi:hypothetical protein